MQDKSRPFGTQKPLIFFNPQFHCGLNKTMPRSGQIKLILLEATLKALFIILIFPLMCWSETVSVIVPCHYKHVYLLPELLHHISLQTWMPDEVVISVSGVEKLDSNHMKFLERQFIDQQCYPFTVHFITHQGRLYAGENRNSACEQAVGDIFITQDVDDIPHPQRIEVLVAIFRDCDIQHIIHKYPPTPDIPQEWNSYSFEKIVKHLVTDSIHLKTFAMISNGNIAIRKEVFENIRWNGMGIGEDKEFNIEVIDYFHKTIVIDADLFIYRDSLSTWHGVNHET